MPRKLGQPHYDRRLPGLPRKDPNQVTVERFCLRCRQPFPSIDPVCNWICPGCNEANLKLSRRAGSRPVSLPLGMPLPQEGLEE